MFPLRYATILYMLVFSSIILSIFNYRGTISFFNSIAALASLFILNIQTEYSVYFLPLYIIWIWALIDWANNNELSFRYTTCIFGLLLLVISILTLIIPGTDITRPLSEKFFYIKDFFEFFGLSIVNGNVKKLILIASQTATVYLIYVAINFQIYRHNLSKKLLTGIAAILCSTLILFSLSQKISPSKTIADVSALFDGEIEKKFLYRVG